jgi:hypothetical protein
MNRYSRRVYGKSKLDLFGIRDLELLVVVVDQNSHKNLDSTFSFQNRE